jgi:hypothetical protein
MPANAPQNKLQAVASVNRRNGQDPRAQIGAGVIRRSRDAPFMWATRVPFEE